MSQPQTSQVNQSSSNTTKVLLFVGEGNFTFTKAFVEKFPPEKSGYLVIATDYSTLYQAESKETIEKLREKGVKIIEEGVDATKLHELKEGKGFLADYKDAYFPRIQFNCPFPANANYSTNKCFQDLMNSFFASCSALQQVGDRIHIVLVDILRYEMWSNVGDAAKQSGYILKCTRAFDDKIYPGYVHVKKKDSTTHQNKKEFVFQKYWQNKGNTGYFVPTYQPLPIIPISQEHFDEERVIEERPELIINEGNQGSSTDTVPQDDKNTETIKDPVSDNSIIIERLSHFVEKLKTGKETVAKEFFKDALNLLEKYEP